MPVPALLLDATLSAGWGTLVGLLAARMPASRFAADGRLTLVRRWEQGGRFWERTGVRRWKDHVPELGTLFGGVSKRRMMAPGVLGIDRLAAETRRAEFVHWAAPAPVVVMPLWTPARIAAVMAIYAIAANAPFIVIQRYNRGRIVHLTSRLTARSRPGATPAR